MPRDSRTLCSGREDGGEIYTDIGPGQLSSGEDAKTHDSRGSRGLEGVVCVFCAGDGSRTSPQSRTCSARGSNSCSRPWPCPLGQHSSPACSYPASWPNVRDHFGGFKNFAIGCGGFGLELATFAGRFER